MSASPEAMLTIAVGMLSPELLATLERLGAEISPELDEPLIIILGKPIDGPGGVVVTELAIVEPTAAQIAQWDKLTGVEADVMAISVVAGVPKAVVEKLPARAFYQAARRIGAFLA